MPRDGLCASSPADGLDTFLRYGLRQGYNFRCAIGCAQRIAKTEFRGRFFGGDFR